MQFTILVADTETTGFGPRAKVCDVAWAQVELRHSDFHTLHFVEALCDPGMPIPADATKVHGITDEMVAGQPTLEETCRIHLPAGPLLVLGHNMVKFDKQYLQPAFDQTNERAITWGDTWWAAKHLWPKAPSHKLQDLKDFFDLSEQTAHRAGGDVRTTVELLQRMLDEVHGDWYVLLELLTRRALPTTIRFGNRHKGKTFAEVAKEDPGYLSWVVSKSNLSEEDKQAAAKALLDAGQEGVTV